MKKKHMPKLRRYVVHVRRDGQQSWHDSACFYDVSFIGAKKQFTEWVIEQLQDSSNDSKQDELEALLESKALLDRWRDDVWTYAVGKVTNE